MVLTADISEQHLIDLARRRTREARTELFENMADLFMSDAGRLTDRERALINGILNKLLGSVEHEVRQSLAEQLRDDPAAPPELIALLANDDIDIARPVLRESPVLQDKDLIAVIKERGREHWLAISARRSLSSSVSDALVDTGDGDVIEGLLRNADAELSHHAMEYLVIEAQRTDKFHEPLLRRAELPPDLAYKLYWFVSAALRRFIVKHFKIAETTVDDLIESSTRGLFADPGDKDPAIAGVSENLAARLEATGHVSPRVLINLLRNGHVPAFVSTYARYASVTPPLVRRILFAEDGESLAVLCRASEMNRNDFATLFLLMQNVTQGLRPLPPQRLNEVLSFFDSIGLAAARAARRHWCRDRGYLNALDELSGYEGAMEGGAGS